jgi:hypothetical protein
MGLLDYTEPAKRDEMRATPRNGLLGFFADALQGVDGYAQKTRVTGLLSDLVGLPDIGKTADRMSYGEPLTTGRGQTMQIRPEAVGAALAAFPVAKPAKVSGATAKELKVAQENAAKMLGLGADNTAADRAAAMGYKGGWWRGGEAPVNGAPTGPWYTSIKDEAADYAARTPAAVRDVREYALPATANVMHFDRAYQNALAKDLATVLEKDGYTAAAKQLRDYHPAGDQISGMEAYKFLQRLIGDGAPEHYLQRLPFPFRQVDGVNSPNYRQALDTSVVRDANRAAFDPARRAERNIFAGVAAGGVALPLLLDQDGAR